MRNSEKLAAIKNVLDPRTSRIIIEQTAQLDGVINKIGRWSNIHRALAVLVGYTEDHREFPGLLQRDPHVDYIKELIVRFPPSTDNFPGELFGSLQNHLDGLCQNVPIVIHTLEQMSLEPSDSAFTLEFGGPLSLDEFQTTVSDITTVIDILKVKNEVSHVWTDFGSSVFGLEIDAQAALAILNAVVSGAEQFRDIIAGFTPEMMKAYFRLINQIIKAHGDEPLDEGIISDDISGEAIKNYASGEVNIDLASDIGNEQLNGIKIAIPKLVEITNRGWNVTCSAPSTDGPIVLQQTVVLIGSVNVGALPPSPDAAGVDEEHA